MKTHLRAQALEHVVERHRSGDLPGAIHEYRRLLELDPENVEVERLLGIGLLQSENPNEAIRCFDRVLSIRPNDHVVRLYRAQSWVKAGNLTHAIADYTVVGEAGGKEAAESWTALARLWRKSGNLELALESYDKALYCKPDDARNWFNRGNALIDAGRTSDAIDSYSRATQLLPDFADAWFNLGTALLSSEQAQASVDAFERLLKLRPLHVDAMINLGNAWRSLQRDDLATQAYESALVVQPASGNAHNNLASIFQSAGDVDKALVHFDAAIKSDPEQVIFHIGKATALKQIGRIEAALQAFDVAVEVAPQHVEAHTSRSLCRLLAGQLKEGFQEYEWRWQSPDLADIRPNFSQPLWMGNEDVRGKRLLLRWEQGLGDTIQFSRYVTLLNARGAKVILQVQKPLFQLMQGLTGQGTLLAEGQPLPEFDCYCPLLSLPLSLGTTLETVPAAIPYIRANREKVKSWREKLGVPEGPMIGLAWSGRQEHKNDKNRSIELAQLLEHLPKGPRWVVLQKDLRQGDRKALLARPDIAFWGDNLQDFSDTAALCECMDLVVSVDTSVAHLAGAMGKELFLLLPFVPDWRWLMSGDSSAWYPRAKLFRQDSSKNWSTVLERLVSEIHKKYPF